MEWNPGNLIDSDRPLGRYLLPTGDGRMTDAQFTGKRPHTAALGDNAINNWVGLLGSHKRTGRQKRTNRQEEFLVNGRCDLPILNLRRGMDTLGDRIKWARNRVGKSQRELAEHIGIRRVSVTQWELNETKPHTKRLPEIAAFLGVSQSFLLDGKVDETTFQDGEFSPEEVEAFRKSAAKAGLNLKAMEDTISLVLRKLERENALIMGPGLTPDAIAESVINVYGSLSDDGK